MSGLAACSSSSSKANSDSTSGTNGPRIAVFAPFPRNDASITEAVINGANASAKKIKGAKVSIVDNITGPQHQIDVLGQTAAANDLVFLASGSLAQAVDVVAPKYPKVWFVEYNATTEKFHPNVTSIVPQLGVSGIVSGAVMAQRSKTKKLGMVTGLQLTVEGQEAKGLTQGAKLVAPTATLQVTYTGDYNDVTKAKQATTAQMANGADGLLGDLGVGQTGFYDAVAGTPTDVYTLGLLDLGCPASPNLVGGVFADFAAITQEAITNHQSGKLQAGALFIGLKKKNLMRYEFCPGKAKSGDEQLATDTTAKIIDGRITPNAGIVIADPGYRVVNE